MRTYSLSNDFPFVHNEYTSQRLGETTTNFTIEQNNQNDTIQLEQATVGTTENCK